MASRPGSVVASFHQSCGPSRRKASMRIMAAPLPWFFTGGSTVKPASRQWSSYFLPGDVVFIDAVMRKIVDGLCVTSFAHPVDVEGEHLPDRLVIVENPN